MSVSIWAYPWDLQDLGPKILPQLQSKGIDMVSLATSYHAGRFLQPGNPRRRVYFPQDGTVYYKLDPAHWRGATIQPLQADIVATEGDWLDRLIAARAEGGPAVSAWTVLLHNTRLGMAHPDHALRTAYGDPVPYGLCPSSPAARDYALRLVQEIAARGPDRIEIESPDFMGFAHGYHHEKDGLPVLPEDEFLLGLCFCDHCLARAAAVGVNGAAARQVVVNHLDAAFAREFPEAQFPDFPARREAAFEGHPALAAWLAWRKEPVISLVREICASVTVPVVLIDHEASWWGGVDAAQVGSVVDGILFCAYHTPQDRIAAVLKASRQTLSPGKPLIAGFLLFHPTVADRHDLAARMLASGGQDFAFYNLGLVPPVRLDWVQHGLACIPG